MKVSIIIPTLNESGRISSTLNRVFHHGGADIAEVIVVDAAGSTDDTAKIAAECGARVIKCNESGRAQQMNRGAAEAVGEILYFVHADVLPPVDYTKDIIRSVKEGNELGFFSYQFDSDSPLLKINAWFTQFDGLLAGGGDQSLYITRKAFTQLGGFCRKHCIMEDFDLIRRARKARMKYEIIKNDAIVSARKYDQNSYLRVNLVNLLIFTLYGLGARPEFLKKSYHRLLK